MKKRYITADELLEESFALAMKVLESGYAPTFIIGVWRGGAPIGIAVQELLEYCGVTANHIAVRTSSYDGIAQRIDENKKTVKVHGLGWAIKNLTADDRVLLVDDVHDSGLSVAELKRQIALRCGEQAPAQIKVAVPYFKPSQSLTKSKPDFYLHETDDWLVFPHELMGLSGDEIERYKPGIAAIKRQLIEISEGRG